MNILPLFMKHQLPTVLMVLETDTLPTQKLEKKLRANISQVSCEYIIIVLRVGACVFQEVYKGIRRGGGKCQENTINFLKFIFPFVYALSETLFMGAAIGR